MTPRPLLWAAIVAAAVILAIVALLAGVDIEVIRRVLRHADIATTLRYVGDTPESLRAAAGDLDKAMGKIRA